MRNYINGNYGKKLTLVPAEGHKIPDTTFDKFESYSRNLKEKDRLGIQLVPGSEGINLFIVTDNRTALNSDDLSWILNGFATFRKGAPVRAFFTNSKRRVYVLAKGKDYDQRHYEYYNPSYTDDLFAELQKTGTKMQILTGIGADCGGCIFLSVPGEMSVRLKSTLRSLRQLGL